MNDFWSIALVTLMVAAVSYAVGSINCAIMISKYHKMKDIRGLGSGNAGMTNMLRNFGKKAAAFTMAGDFIKGVVAVELGRLLFDIFEITAFDGGSVAGIFVVIGHIFPLYFGFKGGKGIATALGVMLAFNWLVFLTIAVGLVPMVFVVRIVSAISLAGAALFPVLIFLVNYLQEADMLTVTIPTTAGAVVISALAFYAHRENIKRLREGTENAFTKKRENKDVEE